MDRARVLGSLNGKILLAYSARTVAALRAVLPLRPALPHLEPFLALNVEKEVRKDALVIGCAAEAAAAGRAPEPGSAQRLYEATRAIDEEFLGRIGGFPVRIAIRYEEVGPPRIERIERLLEASHRLLAAWRRGARLREALETVFGASEFERRVRELLELYALETRALSRSVRLPALLVPLREIAAERLFAIMREEAARLAAELARSLVRARARR